MSVQLEALDILGDLLSRFGGKGILLLGESPFKSAFWGERFADIPY